MGNFRDRSFGGRDRGNSRGGFGGGRSFGGRDSSRGSFGGDRRRPEMHDVVCDKCGKDCQVPFRPTGDKPVLCSQCFEKNGGPSRGSSSGSGMSSEQFNELNSKVDKILKILENVEIEGDEIEEEEVEEQ